MQGSDHPSIYIGDRLVGAGAPAYLIAEMSANHAGSLARAKEIIHAAKESGADCVKIQTYTPDTLTIDCDAPWFHVENGTWEGETLYSLYGKAYTPWEWQGELADEAAKVGIDFLSTPFDKTSVDFLENLGLSFYKIASFEIVDIPLIKYIASKQKPIIMSTGMATAEEIKEAVDAVYETGNHALCLLKCSSAYPADPAQMNLRTIADMQRRFRVPVGLSDHSLGSFSAVRAVAGGACVIEKHFCLSRDIENPDASFSMTPEEYKEMVRDIRETEQALGKPAYGVEPEEESSMVFRRSLFAVADIPKGAALTEENVRSIRPGYGLKPKYLPDVYTMYAGEEIKRGTPLSFDRMEKGAVLFLTDNENTTPLYEWLKEREKNVYRITNALTAEMAEALAPSFVVSFNYRHIIPADVLSLLQGKIVNLHISLLPYNRGSAPNFFSFWDGTPSGVTIHQMDEGLDTGAILCRKELQFDTEKETFASTYDALLAAIQTLFRENWEDIKAGRLAPSPQPAGGTCHKTSELTAIRERFPFSWDENIADFLHRAGKDGRA